MVLRCSHWQVRRCQLFRLFVNVYVPLGIPHVSLADDIHDGYFIPKGAIIFQNLWFVLGEHASISVLISFFRLMSHDPAVYKNPMTFDPTRFMGPNPEQDVREYCFGFGRR